MTIALEAFSAIARDGMGAIDVGARGDMHPVLARIAPLVHLTGFEPDADECRRLNTIGRGAFRSAMYLPYALAADSSARTLHLCRSGGASSLLRPYRVFLERFEDPERFDIVETRSVETTTLDTLRQRSQLPAFVGFVKLDAQGGELDVLVGASGVLREVVAVEVEVEFASLYEAQPLFRDVDQFMATQGFSLFKLRRMQWVRRSLANRPGRSAGQTVFGDALYLRDPLAGGASSPVTGSRAEALALLACAYDCHDFALELIADKQVARTIDAGAIRNYVAQRLKSARIRGLWRRRADRAALFSWLSAYGRQWARGDLDFYSRI